MYFETEERKTTKKPGPSLFFLKTSLTQRLALFLLTAKGNWSFFIIIFKVFEGDSLSKKIETSFD